MATKIRAKCGGEACGAVNCTNARRKCPNKSFFRFPKDEIRCQDWVRNSRRLDLVGKPAIQLYYGGYVLCADHFDDGQFRCPIKKKRLKCDAIPMLMFLPNSPLEATSEKLFDKQRKLESQIPPSESECSVSDVDTFDLENQEQMPSMSYDTVVSSDNKTEQDPEEETKVKTEVDDADQVPLSFNITQHNSQELTGDNVTTENTLSNHMGHTSNTQAVPSTYTEFWIKPEINTDDADNIQMGQTSKAQDVSSPLAEFCVKPETNTEDTDIFNVKIRAKRGGEACGAVNCTNARRKCPNKSFFRFPKDEIRCQDWVQNSRRLDLVGKPAIRLYKGGYVLCADHFDDGQFRCPIKKKRLKCDAIPSLTFLPNYDEQFRCRIKKKRLKCDAIPSLTFLPNSPLEATSEKLFDKQRKLESQVSPTESKCSVSDEDTFDLDSQEPMPSMSYDTVVSSDNKTEQDPEEETKMKTEIDDADQVPPLFNIIQHNSQELTGDNVTTENTLSNHMGHTSNTQAVPSTSTGFWIKPEINTDDADNIQMGQTSKAQDVSSPHAEFCVKPEINTEDTDSFLVEQTSESQAVPSTDVGMKEEVCTENIASIQMGKTEMQAVHNPNFWVKIEVCTDDTCSIQMGQDEDAETDQGDASLTVKFPWQADMQQDDTGQKLHTCQLCDATFKHPSNLKRHMLRHTGHKPNVCQECGATFTQSNSLKRHMLTHTGEKPFTCQLCGATFRQSGHLRNHMENHEGHQPYSCQQCDTTFIHYRNFKRHIMRAHTVKTYACHLCDFTFTQPDKLKDHMQAHPGEKHHACKKCDASFAEASDLRQHRLLVHVNRRYACPQCDAKFTRSTNLKSHLRIHSGQKPYTCQHCDARFTWSANLKKHMIIHTRQESHACQQCDAVFMLSSQLKRHMASHTGQKLHACEQCDALFTMPSSLRRHQLIHTGEKPYACKHCTAVFKDSRHLKKHMAQHTGQKRK